jgi:hypothetical protein
VSEVWYRYEDVAYSALPDPETGESRGLGSVAVHLREYKVVRRTAKSAWLDLGFGDLRVMRLTARRRFACATKQEALASFVARKKRQISIHVARADRARRALEAARRLDPITMNAIVGPGYLGA